MIAWKNLTWTCHVCREERPDAYISVYSSEKLIDGKIPMKQNVRYCNDRPDCLQGAREIEWIKG